MKTNKIFGILMAVLMVASAVALVSARPIPNDCISVIASNHVPEEANVTSYYGNGTVYESWIIPAHYSGTPADGVQMHVPKNGYVGVNDNTDYLPAQKKNGDRIYSANVKYVDDPDAVSRSTGRKIGLDNPDKLIN
jgi:hypothetical protein